MASAIDSTPRTRRTSGLEVKPLSGSLGAEIRGIDLAMAGAAEADARERGPSSQQRGLFPSTPDLT